MKRMKGYSPGQLSFVTSFDYPGHYWVGVNSSPPGLFNLQELEEVGNQLLSLVNSEKKKYE